MKYIRILVLSFLIFSLTACALSDTIGRVQQQTNSVEQKPEDKQYIEEALQLMEQVTHGNLYERTPNNFIQGIDQDLSRKQLQKLKDIVKEMEFDSTDNNAAKEEGKARYHIRLYGKDGNNLMDLEIYDNDEIWCKNRRIKDAQPLLEWLQPFLGDSSNNA